MEPSSTITDTKNVRRSFFAILAAVIYLFPSTFLHGYEVRYVPIDYFKRVGVSSIRPVRDTLTFLNLIVRTVMYFKPLKIFGPATAALMFLAVAWGVGSAFLNGAVNTAGMLVIVILDRRFPGEIKGYGLPRFLELLEKLVQRLMGPLGR